MQHALAEAVVARDRATAKVAETNASLREIRDERPTNRRAAATAALTLATVGYGKRASELEAAVSTEMAAGFSQPEAVCSALRLLPGEMAEDLIRLVRKAQKLSRDHQGAVTLATSEVRTAEERLRAAELSLQKLLKEAELLVPRHRQARRPGPC